MGATRRDFVVGGVAAALGGGGVEAAHETSLRLDGADVTDEEKDVAKEAVAVFIGSFPAGSEPDPSTVADRARAAIRSWRALHRP